MPGKTQRSLFTAIMTNFDTAVEATEDALNSEGSATEENEKRKDSLKGKVTELNSAWQQLARDSINSDFVKTLLSTATGFVKLVDAVGGLTALTPAVISLIAALEFKKIASGASKLGITLKGVKEYLGVLSSLSKETGESMISVFLETRTSAEMLRLSLIGIGTAVSVAFMAINVAQGIYQKKAQAASDASQALQNKYTEEANELEELGKTYSELISKTNLSTDENNKLTQAIDTLNSKYGMNIDVTDKDTESIENNTKGIKENIIQKKKLAAIEKKDLALSKDDLGSKIWGGSGFTVESLKKAISLPLSQSAEESERFLLNLNKSGKVYGGKIGESINQTIGATTIAGYEENLRTQKELLTETTNKTKEQENALKSITDEYNKVIAIMTTGKEAYSGILDLFNQGIPITNSDALALYNLGLITRAQVNYVNDYNNASDEEKQKLAETQTSINNNAKALAGSQKTTQETVENIEKLNSEIDEMQKVYDSLHSAVDEYNSNGYLTIDTLQSLLSLSPEYLANLSMQNGQLQVNNMSLEDQVNALKYNAIAQLEAAKAADLNALSQGKMKNVSAGAKQAIAGIGNTAVQTGAQVLSSAASFENFASRVLGAVNKLKAAAGQSFLGKWTENAKSKEQKAVENYYNNLEDTIKNLKVDTTHIGTSGKSGGRKSGGGKSGGGKSGSSKSSSETYKAEVDALYAYNNALDIAKDRVDALNDALKNTDNYEEQEKYIRQLINATNDQIARTNDLKNAQVGQINSYINQLRQQGFAIDYNASKNELYINNMQHLADFTGDNAKNVEKIIKKIQELNKDNRSLDGSIRDLTKSTKDYYDKLADLPEEKLKKFKELLKDFQQSQLDQVQNQITDLEHAMKQDPRLKALEEQIEALENQNDELDKQKELEEKLLAVEEAKEKLANQRRQKTVQIYREGIGWTWESDIQEIEDAQKDLEDAQKDLNDKIKQDQLDALKAEKDALEKSYQDKIDVLQDFLDEQNYQIDKANRNAIQTFQKLQEEMVKFGLDNAQYLSQATNWLNNYNTALASLNNTVNSLMGSATANGTLYSSSMQDRISTALSSIMPEITSTGLTLGNVDFNKISGDNSGQTIYIDKIELPNVKDVDDFVEALKDLPRIASSNVTNRT